MEVSWNLWHGCKKYSEGCERCYVYRGDAKYGRDSTIANKTQCFNKPIEKYKNGEYKVKSGSFIWTCFSSDFLLDQADKWRDDAWNIIRERKDCHFLFITKRITRFKDCIPDDWEDGWDNVTVVATVENQRRADERLPVFLSLPIKHKCITLEPLLEKVDISKYLDDTIEQVIVGGESGENARVCNYEWVLYLREQCIKANVSFYFKQTGANFMKDGKIYNVPRNIQHQQARKAMINVNNNKSYLK